MAIIGIVAIDRNGAIGKDGAIPWHYSGDMKFFRETTTGSAVVMGFNTWLSLKKPLKDRINIVLTRTRDIEPREGVEVYRDRESVLEFCKTLDCDLFIIGGEQIYNAFSEDIEKWYVTEIPLDVEGADAFLSDEVLAGFEKTNTIELEGSLIVSVYERT